MKKLSLILFLFVSLGVSAQFNPTKHTLSNKPYVANGKPTDARSFYYDPGNFTYRPYANRAEILSTLNSTASRTGNFPIFLDSAGVRYELWFRSGTADADLQLKDAGTAGATTIATTLADLKSKTPSTSYAVTMGTNTAGDGGGREYFWDAFNNSAADGISIIIPDGWEGVGRWVEQKKIYKVHARQLGLYGDNRTTEAAAIKSAFTLATSKGWEIDVTGMTLNLNGDSLVLSDPLLLSSSNKSNSIIRNGKYIIPKAGIKTENITFRDFTVAAIGISANPAKQHYPITQKWPVHIKNNAFKNNYRDVYEINNIANSDTTGTAAILTGEFSNNTIDSFGYASIQLDMPYENVSINENKWKGLGNPAAFNYVVQLGLDGNANIFKQRNLDISHNQLKDLMHTQDPSGTFYGFLVSGLNINFSFNQQDNVSAPSYVRGSNITAVYNKMYLYGQYSKHGLIIKDGRPEGHLVVDHNIIEGNFGSGVYIDAQYFKADITHNTIKLVPFSTYVGDAGIRVIAGDNNWSQLNISENNVVNEQTNTATSAIMVTSSGKIGEVIMDGNWIDSYAAGISAKLISSTRRLVVRNSKFLRYKTTSSFGADVVEIDNNNFHHLTQQTNLYAVTTGLITRNKVRPDSSLVGSSPATLTRMFNIEADVATNNAEYWLIDNEVDQRKLTNMIRIEDSISKLYVLRDKILNGVASTSSAYVNSVTGAPLTMNLEVYGFINPYSSRLFNSSTDNQTINVTVRDSKINLDAFMAFTGASQVYNNLTISGLDVPTNPNISVNFLNPDVTVELGLNKRSLGTPAYTLISADILKGKSNVIEAALSGAITITVPPASTANFPLGTQLKIFQAGNGAVTLAAGAGVTIVSPNGLSTSAINQYILLEKVTAPDGWRAVVLGGAGGTADLSNYVTNSKFDSATIAFSGTDFEKNADSQVVIKYQQVYDVRRFGAIGDSATNNTTAFRSAIASAAAQGGGVVFIPEGAYFSDSLSIPRRVSLLGSGIGTTRLILVNNSAATTFLSLYKTSESTIRDFTLDGNKANQTNAVNGIDISTDGTNNYNYNLLIENIYSRNNKGHGLIAKHPSWIFTIQNFRARDNDKWGIYNGSTDSRFINIDLALNAQGGFFNYGANTIVNTGKIIFNGFANPGSAGIYDSSSRSQFRNLEVQENYYHGIVLKHSNTGVFDLISDMNNVIRRPQSTQYAGVTADLTSVAYGLKMINAKNNDVRVNITSANVSAEGFTQYGKFIDATSTGNTLAIKQQSMFGPDSIVMAAKNKWIKYDNANKIVATDADFTITDSDTSTFILTATLTRNPVISLPPAVSSTLRKIIIVSRGPVGNAFNWTLSPTVGGATSTEISSIPNNSVVTIEQFDNGSGQWRITNIWEPLQASTAGVSSFNTRTGAVVPAANDYSFSQISGSVGDAQLSTNVALKNGTNTWTGTNDFGSVTTGALATSTNSTNANFNVISGSGGSTSSSSKFLFGGAASINYRTSFGGSTTTTIAANNNYAHTVWGNMTIGEAASGNHAWIVGAVVKNFTITGAAATVGNTALVYLENGNTATVTGKNYSLYAEGEGRFNGLTDNSLSGTGDRVVGVNAAGQFKPIGLSSFGFYDTTFKVFTSTNTTTPQTLIQYAAIDNTSGTMTLEVHGISSSGGFVAYKRFIRFKRVSGTLTLYAVNTPFLDDEDAAMSTCEINIVSTAALAGNIQFNVTGISSLVEWKANVGITYHFLGL